MRKLIRVDQTWYSYERAAAARRTAALDGAHRLPNGMRGHAR